MAAPTIGHALITAIMLTIVLSRHYYVKPTESSGTCHHQTVSRCECPEDDADTICETLGYYMQSQNKYFLSNTVFYFLEGVHRAPPSDTLFIYGVNNLSFIGLSKMVQGFHETVRYSKAVIECEPQATNIVFLSSSNIVFSLISIKNCGRKPVKLMGDYRLYHYFSLPQKSRKSDLTLSNVSIATFDIYNLTISKTSIQNSYGYGFLAINTFNMIVNESSFANSNFRMTYGTDCVSVAHQSIASPANFAIYFFNPNTCSKNPPSIYSLKIISTNVSFGYNLCLNESYHFVGAGLRIVMEQSGAAYGIDTLIDRSTFYGNTALKGSNIMFKTSYSTTYYTFSMRNSISTEANVLSPIKEINAESATAMFIVNGVIGDVLSQYDCNAFNQLKYADTPIALQNNSFSYNVGTSIMILYTSIKKFDVMQNIVILSTTISRNRGTGFCAISQFGLLNAPLSLLFNDVSVTDNITPRYGGTVALNAIQNVTMKNALIADNMGSGIVLINTNLILTGRNVTFSNNFAFGDGGALNLVGNSYILLSSPYNVFFINNSANRAGGAINVYTLESLTECFLQEIHTTESTNETNSIVYANNSAGFTGSLLFGGNIDECFLVLSLSWNIDQMRQATPIMYLRNYNEIHNDSFGVSSNAGRVCFCEESEPKCNLYSVEKTAHPGDEIGLMLVVVGQTFGLTTGTISSRFFIGGQYVYIRTEAINWDWLGCGLVYLQINGLQNTNDSFEVQLSVDYDDNKMSPKYLDANISVLVEILDCPVGFELSLTEGTCDCDQHLVDIDNTITCNIGNNTVTKSKYVWIGFDNSSTSCIMAHSTCPFDYCKAGQVTFTPSQHDEQCANNRSGVLCGQCAEGMSVLLGSNRCAKCSNAYIGLFLVFAVTGIMLIMGMLLFNLTVTLGTFNGLVFFANIVKLHDFVFFSDGPIPFITHFVSWVNLDFGIESCLYDGMDDYIKMWLQFAFPLYIWTTIGAIVFLSRYTKFNKLIGRNAIKGLATLVLLSFNKLLRTVTLCLSSVTLHCVGSNERKVHWYVDPNIVYFSKQFMPIFVIALAVILILILPYTVGLLTSQVIERRINKLQFLRRHWLSIKPFFDAYGGPYKEGYQFWTGLLLITRVSFLCVILFTTSSSTLLATIITTIAVLLISLIWMKGVYKQLGHDVMESGHMFILILMCCLHVSGHRQIGTILGVGLVIAMFLASLFYHLMVLVRESNFYKKCKQTMRRGQSMEFIEFVTDTAAIDSESTEVKAKSTSTVSVVAVREPLIYDDDDEELIHL